MRHTLVGIIFTLALSMPIMAQKTGIAKYAGEFMATGFGGRALALGGAYSAAANDVTAAYWNPAGLMAIRYPEIGLMYEQRYGGLLNYNYGGVAWPLDPKYTIALSVTRVGIDDNDDTRNALIDLNGNGVWDEGERLDNSKIKKFNVADWVAYLTYAFNARERLNLGVNMKLVARTMGGSVGASAYGIGFDVGAQYALDEWATVGVTVQDVTTTLIAWSTGTNDLVSPTVKVGGAYRFDFLGGTIMPALDIDIMGENRRTASLAHIGPVSMNPRAGIEYQFRNLFAIRAGMNDTQNFTVGAGVHLPKLFLDYAFGQSPLSSEFKEQSHRISIRLSLEEKRFFRESP
ncbi:MAG: PorV/PorQ family protein [Bacteroidota bacterium]|nr:PorV/PorQ family protein [Bacteroidota bacterium]